MPSVSELASLGQEALLLAVALSLPVVGIAALVGLIVAVFQAASQVQDQTLAHLPKIIVVALAVALLSPWMGAQIASFAIKVFQAG